MEKEKIFSNTPYDDVFRTLLNDCSELIIPLIILVEKGELEEYTKITIEEMTNKVIQNIAKAKENVRKEVGSTMVGPTLDYEAKRILNKGISQGEDNLIINALKTGKSPESIAEYIGVDIERILSIKSKM